MHTRGLGTLKVQRRRSLTGARTVAISTTNLGPCSPTDDYLFTGGATVSLMLAQRAVFRLHQTQPRLMQPRWSARMARLMNWATTPALHLQKARRARPPQRCVCPIRAVGSTGCAPMGDGPMGFPVPASSFDRHCVDVHTTTQQLRSFPVHSPGWIIEHPGFLSHVQPEAPC
jgi:hypothetical protein